MRDAVGSDAFEVRFEPNRYQPIPQTLTRSNRTRTELGGNAVTLGSILKTLEERSGTTDRPGSLDPWRSLVAELPTP